MDMELFTRLFAHVANPPTFKTLEPSEGETGCVSIVGTPFYVTSYSSKAGIARNVMVNTYTLSAETEDDWVDLFTHRYLSEVVVKAVAEYVEWRCRNTLDDMATDAMAADYQADQRDLQNAYDEGRAYFDNTPADQRKTWREANPYPYGIAHYDRWTAGYLNAEAASVF